MNTASAKPAQPIASMTPRRDMYQHHLKMIAYSLAEAARLNPNEEHRLMTILSEIKTIQAGR